MPNVAETLDLNIKESGENNAIIWGESRVTYNELHEAVYKLAGGLRKLGIKKGDRTLLMLPNIPHFPVAYYAALAIGAVIVPVNIMFKDREIAYQLEDSEAVAAIGWEGFADDLNAAREKTESLKHLILLGDNLPPNAVQLTKFIAESSPIDQIENTESGDLAVILYTAGVTGHPKGAELTHGGISHASEVLARTLNFTRRDKILAVVPFFHSFGGSVIMNAGLAGGSTLILAPKFNPQEALQIIQKHRATIFAGVPTMFQLLYDQSNYADYDVSSLKYCLSGGSHLPEQLLTRFEERFSTYILEGYGLSETCSAACFNNFKRERKPGVAGYPLDGIEMKVVDDNDEEVSIGEIGEIVIKGKGKLRSGTRESK
ncbi:MAG: AMP-binding protein [FCB group bacterium]|nr:AMP-binding protein [FCB group bacterium]